MSGSSPPSFDTFFDQQKRARSPSAASLNTYGQQGHFTPGPSHQLAHDFHLTDEPSPLDRRSSNASLRSHGRSRGESSSSVGGMRLDGTDGLRQDSLPLNPESSTLIATAPRGGPRQSIPQYNGQPHVGDIVYSPRSQQFASPNYLPDPQWPNGGVAQWANMPNSATSGSPYTGDAHNQGYMQAPPTASSGSEGFAFDHASPYTNTAMTPGQSGWENDFLQSGQGQDWSGNVEAGDEQQQEFMAALDQLVSQASSRAASPAPQQPEMNGQSQFHQNSSFGFDPGYAPPQPSSRPSSRSGSPFPQISQNVSPAYPRSGSSPSTNSPFIKAQSPPALVIPNHPSPAPTLPPIVTSQPQDAGSHSRSGVNLAGQTSMGGLLPPINPALEGLTGMAGISPIGPNVDGPMIYIQPSTPISGIKDGRGMFDAALRRAGQMAQANRQLRDQRNQVHQHGDPAANYTVPPPAPSPQPQVYNEANMQNEYVSMLGQNQPLTGHWSGFGDMQAIQTPLFASNGIRPRAKSDSYGSGGSPGLDRAALLQYMAASGQFPGNGNTDGQNAGGGDRRTSIDSWRAAMLGGSQTQQPPQATVDPRQLPGNDMPQQDPLQSLEQQHQLSQLQAQRARISPLNVNTTPAATGGQAGVFKYEPGEFSPTSLAFYQQLGMAPGPGAQLAGTNSAPFFSTTFQNIPQNSYPQTAAPGQSFLAPGNAMGERRRSFAEGMSHHAAGAGTPGYGVGLMTKDTFGSLSPGRLRGVSPGHRRAAKSEDLGRPGSGWGVGAGGSTTDFLNSITANDGSLLPPSRGRSGSHSRHSSASSARSASPALSISSQGSSGYHERMEMPDGGEPARDVLGERKPARVAKMKVTSMATEVASTSRRTNHGVFKCPVPGCGSTFTRHFNLKGHLRSHADIRPYKCLYDGCPKSIVGFARQHDCKRHMLLHEGLRPFECEGCGKKFARLDALTRHHKSEQGQECAISHPLPVNPDGTAMSESQYKAYRAAQDLLHPGASGDKGGRRVSFGAYSSGGDEDVELGNGSGMEDYDFA